MSGRRNILATVGFVASVSLITAAVLVLCVSYHDSRRQFALLNAVCSEMVEQDPETAGVIATALKEYRNGNPAGVAREDVLVSLGYRAGDFAEESARQKAVLAAVGFLAGVLLFLGAFLYRNHREALRIRALTDYLEQANMGRAAILSTSGDDDLSKLEDAIYKTVTYLYQTKDAAIQARNDFADNLSNIAHQIKTPITAISLSVQTGQSQRITKQLERLTHLQEALLVLSRLDAGTLLLKQRETDVFTLLVLAADTLQELFTGSGTAIEIPEQGKMRIVVDLEWTMEAVMNLMKNCMEHNRGGTVHCFYAQNPLYTEILIWDEGEGFVREDLPRLFERFYRGQNASEGGIGIGLALAKEIVERQNGTIRARNKTGGGALFEIRFYSH